MLRSTKPTSQTGFTLVEFMLATAFFTFILMLVTAGFMQITRSYVQGVTTNKVHQAGRDMMETFAREIRGASESSITQALGTGPDSDKYCLQVGGSKYVFIASDQSSPGDDDGQIHKISGGSCDDFSIAGGQGLVDKNELSVQYLRMDQSGDLYTVYLALSSGSYSNDLLEVDIAPDAGGDLNNSIQNIREGLLCMPGQTGGQFCDVVFLRETISLRN